MALSFFLVPYDIIAGAVRGAPGSGRRLAIDSATPDILAVDGDWTETEIDRNATLAPNGQAVVRVRATPSVIANLSLNWPLVADPSTLWTTRRTVPRWDGSQIAWGGSGNALCRDLADLDRDVRDDQGHGEDLAVVDALVADADRIGYRRLGMPWRDASRILRLCAKRGYGLNRISTGTFPTTGILDNFNRADEDPLANGNWSGPLFSGGGQMRIVTNHAETAAGGFGRSYWSAANFGSDCEAYIDTTTATPAAGEQLGLFARIANAGTTTVDCYDCFHLVTGSIVVIERIDDGAETQLGASISNTLSSGEGLGLEIIGSTITAYKKSGGSWSSLGSRTDSTYSAAGRIALGSHGDNAEPDDFGGGTIPAARRWFFGAGR